MNAIAQARRAIAAAPADEELRAIERLLHALEAEEAFPVATLYELGFERFELAMGVMREWRLARYYDPARQLVQARAVREQGAVQ